VNEKIERALVHTILKNPFGFKWSLQGFGMLRLYLSRNVRLHVWSAAHQVEDVSVIHDHPWNFESHVLSGSIVNVRYSLEPEGLTTHTMQTIRCGPGGCAMADEVRVCLRRHPEERLGTGRTYHQRAYEIHESRPSDGAVSVIVREPGDDPDHARVFYPVGTKWVSAEPREATSEEIETITHNALRRWI
jgi:hypothetical protein